MRMHVNRCLVIAHWELSFSALERTRKPIIGITFSLLCTAESTYVLTLYVLLTIP